VSKPTIGSVLNGETVALIRRLAADQGTRHRWSYAFAFVCLGLIAVTTAASAWLMRDVVDKIFMEKQVWAIWILSGTVVGLYLVKGFATYGQIVTLSRIANAVVATVQTRLFDHLLRQSMADFSSQRSAEVITRQGFIANSAGSALNLIVTSLGRDLLSVIGLAVVMLVQNPFMSLSAVVVMPGAIWGVQKLVRRARAIMRTSYTQSVVVTGLNQETVHGMKVVKAFALEDHQRARMGAAVSEVRAQADKLARVAARTAPLMDTLAGFAVAGVILYGGWRVIEAGETPGTFMSFITALLLAYEPAKRLARIHVDLSSHLVGVKMMYDLLAEPTPEGDDADRPALAVTGGRVAFEDVSFAYRPDEPVLSGLTLVAEAGRTTALVGRSGGGKSTTLSLLLRFWDPASGRITVDGIDIATVSRRSLRGAIAYVGQDVFLFEGTIGENIALGRPGATTAEVEAAARAAYAHDFVVAFPDGYATQVGENGTQLSGGQRQRIAIARAILKDAPILLLDEATAALDTESERAIQKALEDLSKGRTTLVIAHRLQTIEKADAICVVEGGRVVERGTHDELIAAAGRYAALHRAHFV